MKWKGPISLSGLRTISLANSVNSSERSDEVNIQEN